MMFVVVEVGWWSVAVAIVKVECKEGEMELQVELIAEDGGAVTVSPVFVVR
jgi:hypothetical protein